MATFLIKVKYVSYLSMLYFRAVVNVSSHTSQMMKLWKTSSFTAVQIRLATSV